jgi:hypothetical protein
MARVLYDGLVEYEDGTPSTTSQMAKDVTTFLSWTAEPELDERKKMGMQVSQVINILRAGLETDRPGIEGCHYPLDDDCYQFVRKEGEVECLEEPKNL